VLDVTAWDDLRKPGTVFLECDESDYLLPHTTLL